MRAGLRWARQVRVSRRQIWAAAVISGAVSALIVVTAFGQTGWPGAAFAALRDQHGPAASGSSSGSSGSGGAGSLPSGSGVGSLPTGALPSGGSSASPASGGGETPNGSTSPAGGPGPSKKSTSSKAGSGKTTGPAKQKSKSPIKHVFVISLATASYAGAFGPSSDAPYLAGTLRPKGELLSGYQTISGIPLVDDLALIGGQPANADTLANCPSYDDFPVGRAPNKRGVMSGTGCVYPDTVLTLGDQMDGADLKWRGFVDGMASPCVHPDSTATDGADPAGYDPRDNPFVFFHSLLDLGDCQEYDLPLTQLAGTLAGSAHRVPSFVYISADPCDGGAPGCSTSASSTGTNTTGSTTTGTTTTTATTTPTTIPSDPTVTAGDAFLRRVVPGILHSKAYRSSGALFVLFSGVSRSEAGTRTGGLVLSPFIRAGSTNRHATNAYGVLRTLDQVFGLTPLALAKPAKPVHLIKR